MAMTDSIVTSAAGIAKALGGRKVGNSWIARCPAHEDSTPSLSIREANGGTVLVRCHAGCDQGRVIAALRSRGMWAAPPRRVSCPSYRTTRQGQPDRPVASRKDTALDIRRSSTMSVYSIFLT